MQQHKNNFVKIFTLIILHLFLLAIAVTAQVQGKIFALTLNYKSAVLVQILTLVDVRDSTGTPQNFDPNIGDYKLEIVSSNNEILKAFRFNLPVPIGQQGSINLDFTMGIPYYNNAKSINIYDKGNTKVLEIPLKSATQVTSPTQASTQVKVNAPETKSNFSSLYIILPLLLVFGLLVLIEINRRKNNAGLTQTHQKQNINALRSYVTTNLRRGYGKEQIRNALIKNNYNSKEINEAFKGLR